MCVCTLCCACLSVHVCVFSSALWGHMHVFLWQVCEPYAGKYVACVPGL